MEKNTPETLRTVGLIGLGRMGGAMAKRLMRAGHSCVVFDNDPDLLKSAEGEGATAATSVVDLVEKLPGRKAVWMMIPAAGTARLASEVASHMGQGDILIDGGNSNYRDAVDRAAELADRGIAHLDVGTSGGVHGLDRGYCLMIGGQVEAVEYLEPVFSALSPGVEAAPRSPGREGEVAQEERGFLHCGPAGAGHFVKMVHNGVEYGLMAAYAEGFNLLKHAGIGREDRPENAETAPLRDAKYYQYDFSLEKIAELWRRGSVIPSWLLDLTAQALHDSPQLEDFSGRVSDSGEGRWTAQVAVDEGVPAHVLTAALFDRFESRGRGEFAGQVLSAMRLGFGGHHEKK